MTSDLRAPDLEGHAARAWRSRINPQVADHTASVDQWLVNGPSFHPFWQWWSVGAISLRDIPGVPPANKRYPEAEWEFMIVSLDPECCPPDPDKEGGLKFLVPIDVVYQFHGVTEAEVKEIVEVAVKAICSGRLSPDSDYRRLWITALNATVAHYMEGTHRAPS